MHDEDDAKTERYASRAPLAKQVKAQERPYLVVLTGSGPVGMMYPLRSDGVTLIGRGLDADVRIDDQAVSRRHATITTTRDQDPILEDLGSSNGTFVNGEQVRKQVLRDGDKIQIGTVSILKFSYQDDLDRTFQQELFNRGIRDGLTGIYNKRYFLDQIATEFSYTRRHNANLSLVMFDIDHFKAINDTHGHPAGDLVLKELARIVQKALRQEDILARYGGEEFVVLLRGTDEAGALVFAQRIRRLIKQQAFVFGGVQIGITISLGIAASSDKASNGNELIELADKYLYMAKNAGRDCIAGRGLKAGRVETGR